MSGKIGIEKILSTIKGISFDLLKQSIGEHIRTEYIVMYFCMLFNITPKLQAIAIEINSFCNRKCSFCPNSKFDRSKNKFIDEKIFNSIVAQLKDMNFKGRITFNLYNEPLLNKKIGDYIAYIRIHLPSSFIYLNTNGDFLTLDLWNKLRKNGLDYATISQYDGKISENIKNIYDSLHFIDRKRFNARIFSENCATSNRGGLLENIKNVAPLNGYCELPFCQLCITYEGKAVLCCNDYLAKVQIGDVLTEKIIHIWKGDVVSLYRRKLLQGKRNELPLCNSCNQIRNRIKIHFFKNDV